MLECAVIIYAASAYGIKTKKTKIPVVLILVICDLIEFPVLYCSYGFYRLSYMVLGIVATTLFLEDKWRIKGTSALILFDLVFIVWRQRDPAFFAAFAGKENMSSVVITFLIAGSSILMLLSTIFAVSIYFRNDCLYMSVLFRIFDCIAEEIEQYSAKMHHTSDEEAMLNLVIPDN